MDSNIISAIISSVTAIIVAIITVVYTGKAKAKEEDTQYSIFNTTYTILHRKKDNKLMAIKDGFSWWAFFFNYVWLFYTRLWSTIFSSLLFIIVFGLHFYIIEEISDYHFFEYFIKIIALISINMPILLGTLGNRLLIKKYTKDCLLASPHSFYPIKSIIANTKDNAILKYMEEGKN